ncbi:MAG: exodeoxyribonuclease VII small subunit [Phycisphaerales bacterium]|jgi:exodeoxyribonuclease VII small subunit|nr:exodeoxyribonuclease VII small subunit [Phycisphaerales bacterium]
MSTAKKNDVKPDPSSMSYEEAAEELEAILQCIDGGEIGLEEAMDLHRRGQSLVQRCRGLLDAADEELRQLSAEELAPADAGDDD